MWKILLLLSIALGNSIACGQKGQSGKDSPMALTVMTFNVRYATAPDGENAWPHRKHMALDLIKKHDPDLLGVQEALDVQIREIEQILTEHVRVGVGRDDGQTQGEYSALFIRRTKLGVRESGTRWISSEPEKPGSMGPGARIPRIFVWAECFLPGGKRILVMNAHLDHQSEAARVLGAEQMLQWADARKDIPSIIMGDLNCSPQSKPVQTLTRSDRFRLLMPLQGPIGTFNAFKPEQVDSDMIDHIMVSQHWNANQVQIDRTTVNHRTPSDHWPVISRVTLK